MSALIVERSEAGLTDQITVPYNFSMLDFEEALQRQHEVEVFSAVHLAEDDVADGQGGGVDG